MDNIARVQEIIDDDWLKITDMENFFKVGVDWRNKAIYNLNETMYINIDPSDLKDFTLGHDMFWPLASYKIYGTTRLAWLLMKLNGVKAPHMFDMLRSGDVIKYMDEGAVLTVIKYINGYDEY